MERLGRGDGVLAGHGVDDEERVVRADARGDPTDLLHQLGVDAEPAGGVDDDDVPAEPAGLGERPRRPTGSTGSAGLACEDR